MTHVLFKRHYRIIAAGGGASTELKETQAPNGRPEMCFPSIAQRLPGAGRLTPDTSSRLRADYNCLDSRNTSVIYGPGETCILLGRPCLGKRSNNPICNTILQGVAWLALPHPHVTARSAPYSPARGPNARPSPRCYSGHCGGDPVSD